MIDPEGPTVSLALQGFDTIYCVMQEDCVVVALKFLHDINVYGKADV
jgi:hypothetical protein